MGCRVRLMSFPAYNWRCKACTLEGKGVPLFFQRLGIAGAPPVDHSRLPMPRSDSYNSTLMSRCFLSCKCCAYVINSILQ